MALAFQRAAALGRRPLSAVRHLARATHEPGATDKSPLSSPSATGQAPDQPRTDAVASTATPQPMSFIETVKVRGVNALLGLFVHKGCLGTTAPRVQGGFDKCMARLRVERLGDGTVQCTIPVTSDVANSYGTLHGGAISTLVDVVGTMALLTQDPTRPGVSVELSVSFLAAAKLGEDLIIDGRVLRQGKKLGFTQVDLRRKADNALLATGRHTKAL